MAMFEIGVVTIVLFLAVAVVVAVAAIFARRYHKVPPTHALVVFGGRHVVKTRGPNGEVVEKETGHRIVTGGGTFVLPVIESAKWLPISTNTIPVEVKAAYTKQGVKLSVDGIAQVKVGTREEDISTAAQQLLDKPDEIGNIAQRILEGHIRGVCAQLTVEEINSDRGKLQERIQQEAVPDFEKLGLEVTVFTVRDIHDDDGYLDALGEKRTAEVKRDAVVGKAEAERDATIRVAEAKREQETAQAQALERDLKIARMEAVQKGATAEAQRQAEIAHAEKDRDVKKQQFVAEVQKEKAQADIAYQLEQTKAKQNVAEADAELKARERAVVEREQDLKVVIPRQKAAEALAAEAHGVKNKTIIEAEGKANEARTLAEGEAQKIKMIADAEAERILKTGQATAEAIRLQKLAEAEGAKRLAEALQTPALLELEKYRILAPELSKIAEGMGKSLQNTEKIILMGGNGPADLVQSVASMMGIVPEAVKAITGKTVLENVNEAAKAIKGELNDRETKQG